MQLAGGSGMSGGIGGKFKQKGLSNKRLSAMSKGRKASTSRSKTAARGRGSNLKGAVARRAGNMNRAMKSARRGAATETAAVHTAQWDGAQPGGQAIDGAGAGGISGDNSTFDGSEGVGGGDPINYGGENYGATDDDIDGVGDSGNVTPYQGTLDMIIVLTIIAWVLLVIAGAMADTKWGEGFALIAAAAAILIGVAAFAAGASIGDNFGQGDQANMLMFNGAGLITAGALALSGGTFAVKAQKYMMWIALIGMALSMTNFLM